PSDRVRAFAQDADGALWFGTDNGLARYDGRRTQTVVVEGLEAGRVLALEFDPEDGALWIGTDVGAARLLGGRSQVVAETKGVAVNAILRRGRSQVLLATGAGVVYECRVNDATVGESGAFDPSRSESEAARAGALSVRALPASPLTSVDADQPGPLSLTSLAPADDTGTFYAGSRSRGLLEFKDGSAREVEGRPRAFFVEVVERDASGALWMGARAKGSDSGLYRAFNTSRPRKVGAGVGTVTTIRRGAGDEDLWVGTDGRGALLVRGGEIVERFTFEGTAGGLRSDRIYAIFVDREGVVWFGTDRGACRYDPHAARAERIAEAPESNFVRVLHETRAGELLAGTNRGLFIRETRTGAWRAAEALGRRSIYALAEDARGRLLVGTSAGLFASEPGAQLGATPEDSGPAEGDEEDGGDETAGDASDAEAAGESVRAIEVFQGQTYAASYGRGLVRLEGDQSRQRRTLVWPTTRKGGEGARLAEVTALHADGAGRLWIGTARAGAFIYENGRVTPAPDALGQLREGVIRAIDGRGEGALWFATAKGLFAYRNDKLIAVAPGVEARGVVADDDVVSAAGGNATSAAWCATAIGLLRVRLDMELGSLVSRFDAEQGLPSANAFAVLRRDGEAAGSVDAHGALLVGTNRGVALYRPGASPPPLVPVRALGRRLHAPNELRAGVALDYPQNSLALDVAALSSRTYPEQFQYAFVLRDEKGREVGRRLSRDAQFVMENLTPGAYRVEARAFTKDLIESAPLAFSFTVGRAPFPWTTALLAVLLVLSLVALVWGAWQNWRIRRAGTQLRAAHHELAGARLELANEAERERRRIARDLHDQTLADLRSLMLLADELPRAEGTNGGGDGHVMSPPTATGTAAPATSVAARTPVDPSVFRAEIESVSQEIRRICEDLSPSALENVGLGAALEWALANAVAHLPAGRKFEYEFTAGEEDLDERAHFAPGVRMQIYRIAQEAINNVCRHAAATHVRLAVGLDEEGDFLLALEDDGRGFAPSRRKARPPQTGRGVSNIRARASLIEAEVAWETRPEGGTRFTLRKPGVAKTNAATKSSDE
ncbi:MAG: sensor histidine kinase, partial [Pyrinomonadaceae bacterium]